MKVKTTKGQLFAKSLAVGVIFAVLLQLTIFDAKCESLSDKILRLHVIANSDSAIDQELKLKVRDEMLDLSNHLLSDCENKQAAIKAANENKAVFTEAAKKVIAENGFDYSVTVEITKQSFDTRDYDTFSLPAGVYDSIKVVIGDGAGKNWWCVMFPPVCIPACVDANISDVLENGEAKIVENRPTYEIGFKVVEWYEAAREFFGR